MVGRINKKEARCGLTAFGMVTFIVVGLMGNANILLAQEEEEIAFYQWAVLYRFAKDLKVGDCVRYQLAPTVETELKVKKQEKSQTEPYREYRFVFGLPDEIEVFATAGVSLNKVFTDIYYKGLGPLLPKTVAPFTETIWSVFWTYFFSMWPHDFGHWSRAKQVGGEFIIHKFGIPFPKAEMKLPPNITHEEETLTLIGGFEVNNLMKNQTHIDFYNNNFAHADELVHAFIQEVYYPFYAFVIIPADPLNPQHGLIREATLWSLPCPFTKGIQADLPYVEMVWLILS